MSNLMNRLHKLEETMVPAETPRRVIRLIVEEDEETPDQAIARWCAEHPNEAPPDSAADFIILRSLVSPKPSNTACRDAEEGRPA